MGAAHLPRQGAEVRVGVRTGVQRHPFDSGGVVGRLAASGDGPATVSVTATLLTAVAPAPSWPAPLAGRSTSLRASGGDFPASVGDIESAEGTCC
jgi:hypothetical protein